MKGKIAVPFLTVALLLAFTSPGYSPDLCIEVTKYCQNSVGIGEPITFNGTVKNCTPFASLEVTVVDDHGGPVLGPVTLASGESANFSGSYTPQTSPSTNVVTATGRYFDRTVTATASATCTVASGCRVTGGGNDTAGLAFDGFGWDGTFAEGKSNIGRGLVNRYTFGGQAGANTALPPQPSGEWTHHQQSGPSGRFVFHGGTSSSDQFTEIDRIVCSNPDGCRPSGNPPSPVKQIDFAGVGQFKNIDSDDLLLAGVIAQATHHWFEVHIEDLGEPGNEPRGVDKKNLICLGDGSGTDAFADPPVFMPANCGCADFYRIRIYEAFDPATELPNTSDVIYEVSGYINGGNLQIHQLTGFDR